MSVTFIIPPREAQVKEIRRCPVDGAPYGDDGVPTCNFLHGREVVRVIGGSQ